MPHTAVDLVVIAVILISAVLSFIRGFTREVFSLATWLLAIYLGFTQYTRVTPYLEEHIANTMLRDVAAGCIVFAVVMLFLFPIGYYLRGFVKGEQVTAVDRSLGFVFGAGRGYLLMAILYLIISWVMPDERQPLWLKEANTRPALVYGADTLRGLIPEEQRAMVERAMATKEKSDAKGEAKGEITTEELKPVTVPEIKLPEPAPEQKMPSLDEKLDQLNKAIQKKD